MKTYVETFQIDEAADLMFDADKLERWNALVDGLGLTGQKEITKGEKSPVPYLPMNKSLVAVFETLCPRKVEADKYNESPIPLEILEQIALSKREEYFTQIQIWYNDKQPDPVVVGIRGYYYQSTWAKDRNPDMDDIHFPSIQAAYDAGVLKTTSVYSNEESKYLIGKWADVKHSFDELKAMAIKRYTADKKNTLDQRLRDVKRELEDLESDAFKMFN